MSEDRPDILLVDDEASLRDKPIDRYMQIKVPVPLPQFVPGCTALATPDLVDFAPTVGSSASWSFAIPNVPGLAGVQLFNQALEFGALWSLSNGGQATLF